jgi:hypothetical protein
LLPLLPLPELPLPELPLPELPPPELPLPELPFDPELPVDPDLPLDPELPDPLPELPDPLLPELPLPLFEDFPFEAPEFPGLTSPLLLIVDGDCGGTAVGSGVAWPPPFDESPGAVTESPIGETPASSWPTDRGGIANATLAAPDTATIASDTSVTETSSVRFMVSSSSE